MASTAPKMTFNQVLCGLAEGVAALSMSSVLGYTSAALLSMRKDKNFEINEEEESWVGAIVPLAALAGSLVAGKLLGQFGSKTVCRTMTLPSVLAWFWTATSSSPFQVIIGRLLCGFCSGIQQVTTAVYVSETVHPKLKPKLAIIPAICMMGGFLLITVCGELIGWRGMGWFGAITCLPPLLLFSYLPETPYYLLKSGEKTEALAVLKWIRSEEEAKIEYENLQQSVYKMETNSSSFADILKPPYRWSICVAVLLHIFQQGSGISVVSSFMGIILEEADSSVSQVTASLILTIINFGSMVLVGSIMGKYPRKVFIKFSSQLMVISLLVLSGYLWIKESEGGFLKEIVQSFTYLPLLAILGYTFGFSLGWGPLPWMFIGDGLPLKIRGTGAGVVIATNWGFNFLTTKTYTWGKLYLGSPATFFAYSQLCLLGMITMGKFIPETFGFTDVQLEKYYEDSYKPKKE